MVDLPVVCTLSPAALKARRQNLLGALWARAAAIHDVANGYRLEFAADADMLPFIAQTIEAERQCCRFLRFQVMVEPDGGPSVAGSDRPAWSTRVSGPDDRGMTASHNCGFVRSMPSPPSRFREQMEPLNPSGRLMVGFWRFMLLGA